MKYKTMKLFLISLMFILVFISLFKRLDNINFVNSQIKALGDNVIVRKTNEDLNYAVSYDKDYFLGFSNKEIEDVKKNKNIQSIILGEDAYTGVVFDIDREKEEYYDGFINPNLSKLLDYKYGSSITKNNGVVISENMVPDVIKILKKDINESELIGQKVDVRGKSYIIEGIYKDELVDNDFVIDDKELLKERLSQKGQRSWSAGNYNSQKFFSSPEEEQKKYKINIINEETGEVDRKASYEGMYTTENGWPEVDYEGSVKNGVSGLVDPETSEYPVDSVNNMFIKLKKGTNKKEFTNFVNEKTNNKYLVISSENKYGDIFETYDYVYILQFVGLGILLGIFVLENKKRK